MNGQSLKPRRARFRFDLSDSEAGGGADPARKGQTGIDVVAGSKRRRELFVGECKWRNSFDAGKATQELVRRAQLISGYDKVRYGLFTKDQISAGFAGTLGPEWTFVDAERLYEE